MGIESLPRSLGLLAKVLAENAALAMVYWSKGMSQISRILKERIFQRDWRERLISDLEVIAGRAALEGLHGERHEPQFGQALRQALLSSIIGLVPRGTERLFFLGLAQEFDQRRKGWREGGLS
jgi:hypothetical protein